MQYLPDLRSLNSILLFCCCRFILCFSWNKTMSFEKQIQNQQKTFDICVTSISFLCWSSLCCLMFADGKLSILGEIFSLGKLNWNFNHFHEHKKRRKSIHLNSQQKKSNQIKPSCPNRAQNIMLQYRTYMQEFWKARPNFLQLFLIEAKKNINEQLHDLWEIKKGLSSL